MARQMPAETEFTEFEDMTECSICTEVFTDPRVLPCIHTFCLKCLLNYGKDRQPGDTMTCPLCKNEFTVSHNGLAGTEKNFFVEKLVHIRKLSMEKDLQRTCDACSGYKTNVDANTEVTNATMYCVQCEQNYCDQCSSGHRRMKISADHVQLKLGKMLQKTDREVKLPAASCEIHTGEELKVFCLECNLLACTFCFLSSHQNHKWSDVIQVSTDRQTQVKREFRKVSDFQKKTRELLDCFRKKNDDFINHISHIKSEINATADELIVDIQRHRMKLLSEIESIRQKRVKQLETVKEKLEEHMKALESFKRYSETLLSSGTACDVARSAKRLQDRAEELTKFDVAAYVQRCKVLCHFSL